MQDFDSPPRADILHEAIRLTCGSRNESYGPPSINLGDCAELWSAYINAKYAGTTLDRMQFCLTAEDVAWLNVLQKIARTFQSLKADNYTDAAAYAAIAGECAIEEQTQ